VPLIVLLARIGLRVIAGVMLAAALGAAGATIVSSAASTSRPEWLQALSTFAIILAVALGTGAIGYLWMMPSRAELIRQVPRDDGLSLPLPVVLMLAGLAIIAVWQAPSVLAWWTRNLTLLRELMGGDPDPLGLWVFPMALLFATPVLTCLALIAFVLSAILALLVPPEIVTRVLGACLLQQGGLVAALYWTERALRQAGTAVQRFVDSGSDPDASAQVAAWLTRFDAAAGSFSDSLVWLLGGSFLALALAEVLAPRRRTSESEPAPQAGGVGREPPPRPARAPVSSAPASASDFGDTAYSVRPRNTWLGPFAWTHSEYDIVSIPPMPGERFSLSWTTGKVRREPQGPNLLSIGAGDGGVFSRRSYDISDARTGAALGTLAPLGHDWEIRDASGEAIAQVLEIEESWGRARYLAKAGEHEVCRFVWGFLGMTVSSAELQIEFLSGADGRFHKAFAIVLGPILEHRSRRKSRWSSS
jgi:hypothetical protein